MIHDSILDTVGNTPMVRINKMNKNKKVELLVKLEGFNPTGSVKDRIALNMINEAEKQGVLKPGDTIIEATSGNTGIGIAMVGTTKGYKVILVMSAGVSVERRKIIQAFGGEIILTDPKLGTDGAISKVAEIMEQNPGKYFNPNQFANENNYLAHYKTTAEEIWKQTDGKITHFVASVGTSGTLMGVGKGLREKNPNIKIVEAQPVKGHAIQGLKSMEEAIVPKIYDPEKIDIRYFIETEEAYAMARRIVSEEGIFIGMSSGAAMIAALKLIDTLEEGVVVCLLPDRGDKYLSTKLFELQE